MKYLFSVFAFVFSLQPLSAQDSATINTYALVVGIANYENPNINLNYSNRDAVVFSEFLQSRTGGSVPKENIRLLIDTNATTSAIYTSLSWLKDQCAINKMDNDGRPCRVYIYFSGHGDVETETKANLGFLLAFNTPPNNYLNNAVRVEDLNDYAHKLSVDLNANVIIITDACHSGKLAGNNNRGTYLVGKELSTARDKEIRIASCNPDELSNEDERWGGGRGVFSWYLINGLKGLADRNRDNEVTLDEIKYYVDSSIAHDPVVKEENLKQTPVLEGNKKLSLAVVDKGELQSLANLVPPAPAPLPPDDADYFFNFFKNRKLLTEINYRSMLKLPRSKIALAIISDVLNKADTSLKRERLTQLTQQLRSNPEKLKLFEEKLVNLIHAECQQAINQYLEGDAQELERRKYYNGGKGYDAYPLMYQVASKLVDADNPLGKILSVNQYYFSGINYRLKYSLAAPAEKQRLLALAIAAQQHALSLNDNAAYIQNELGILHFFKREYNTAEQYYRNAAMLAPEWAVPWANMGILYASTNKDSECLVAAQNALDLQENLQGANLAAGMGNESRRNFLLAEEFYRRAIDINSRPFGPFERLGNIYLQTMQYAQADSFLYEADLRKRGFPFVESAFLHPESYVDASPAPPFVCDIDFSLISPDDVVGLFYWSQQEYAYSSFNSADMLLRRVLRLDPENPLAWHYLGKVYYDQKKWEEADYFFRNAQKYFLDVGAFNKRLDSMLAAKTFVYDHSCLEKFYRIKQYDEANNDYFLGSVNYEWSHYITAEKYYRRLIQQNPGNLIAQLLLLRVLEKSERFTDGEALLKDYQRIDPDQGERELKGFYKRAIEHFPGDPQWPHRLGLMLYSRGMQTSAPWIDTIVFFPRLNKEVFVDENDFMENLNRYSLDVSAEGAERVIRIPEYIQPERNMSVPGTEEIILASEEIRTPRKDAIFYLKMADSLYKDPAIKSELNAKIGALLWRAGSPKQAFQAYKKSVELDPDNNSARIILTDLSEITFHHRDGLEQLNYFYEKGQLNFEKRLLYISWLAKAGEYEKADSVLAKAYGILPNPLPVFDQLGGQLYYLSGQFEKAASSLTKALELNTKDPVILYSLASAYARTGNMIEAWKKLEAARSNGFNYAYVLNTDPVWNRYRNTSQWIGLMKKYPLRRYYFPPLPKAQ